MARPFVELRGLSRTYRAGCQPVAALKSVELEIARGEFIAINGVSGSGKSTLLHLLGGLDTPTAGRIRVGGRDLDGMSRRERVLYRRVTVGFVFQAFYLVPSMTAHANVALALTLQGTYGSERKERARESLRRVGLADRLGHRPGELSGGEQQRVALARALVHGPALLLADEPTGNLDRQTALEVVELMRDFGLRRGTTVVMVTHDAEIASRYADRVVQLRDGQLLTEQAERLDGAGRSPRS